MNRAAVLAAGALALLGACAPAASTAGPASPAAAARPRAQDVAVVRVDTAAHAATDPEEVVMLSYVGEPRPVPGCTLVARLYTTAMGPGRAQAALKAEAAELGATVVVVSQTQGLQEESNMTRTGVGVAATRTSYSVDALDCR